MEHPTLCMLSCIALDLEALEPAHDLAINVSVLADTALVQAATDALRKKWLAEKTDAFKAEPDLHKRHEHSLVNIMISLGGYSWTH